MFSTTAAMSSVPSEGSSPFVTVNWELPTSGPEVYPPHLEKDEFAVINPNFWGASKEVQDGMTGWYTFHAVSDFVTVVYFSHFSDIFKHSLFAFSSIFCYVLCLFLYVSLTFYGQLSYLIPSNLSYCSEPILLLFPFISSKFSHHTLENETSY